jgi:hypothetical protein
LAREVFEALLDEAVQAELQSAAGAARLWTEPCAKGVARGVVKDQLLALLKAFLDAARPAGGLKVDSTGCPQHLDRLLAAGFANARGGDSAPKLLAKVRAGKPVDLRLAEAALAFFRCVLDRPAMALEHLGAVETQRLHAVRRVEAAIRDVRDELPASVYEGLRLRAEEAAAYAAMFDEVVYEYRDLQLFVDVRGAHRVRLLRVNRYRPVRLTSFAGVLRPVRAYEWHEWTHVESACLSIRLLDDQGRRVQEIRPPVCKRVDAERGVVMFEIEPEAQASLRPWLTIAPAGPALHGHEVEWQETMVFNAADRDIVVSYQPMHRPRIVFDDAAHPGFRFHVGDSPGLRRVADGWQLDRTLMPREVLAVRFRWAGFDDTHAQRMSPSGECYGDLPGLSA